MSERIRTAAEPSDDGRNALLDMRWRAFNEGMPSGASRTRNMALDWLCERVIELEDEGGGDGG